MDARCGPRHQTRIIANEGGGRESHAASRRFTLKTRRHPFSCRPHQLWSARDRSADSLTAWRVLSKPGWWGALAVLLANDHLGKAAARQGAFPDVLAGKLSDVAGLAMAPALAWAVSFLLVRRRSIAWCAFVCVPIAFCVLNLSQSAAGTWVSAWRSVGISIRFWCDPTDLLTLPAVLLGYHWVRNAMVADPKTSHTRRNSCAHFGLILGSLACMATSTPKFSGKGPALVNVSGAELLLAYQTRHTLTPCEGGADALLVTLDTNLYSSPRTAELAHGEGVLLSSDVADGAAGETGMVDQPCGSAIVSATGVTPTVVHWNGSEDLTSDSYGVPPGMVYVEMFGSERRLSLGPGVTAAALNHP